MKWTDDTETIQRVTRKLDFIRAVDVGLSEREGKRFKHLLCSICMPSDASMNYLQLTWPTEAVALLRQWADELEAAIAEGHDDHD